MGWLLLAVWTFAIGALVGSFLNVVVYRLPRGMSIVWPGSHCPACRRPIAWYDNIPVLSWLVLRAKCRRCGAPISARYPVVESLTAAVFLTVGLLELFSGVENLWGQIVRSAEAGIVPHRPMPELVATFLVDVFVLSTVLAAALIEYDKGRPPVRLFVPALVLAVAAAVAWPQAHPTTRWFPADGRWAAVCDTLLGLALGMTFGLASAAIGSTVRRSVARMRQPAADCPTATAPAASHTQQKVDARGTQSRLSLPSVRADPYWLSAGCIGGQFGTGAAAVICGGALVAICITAPLRRRLPPSAWLLIGALVWLAAGLR